MEDDFKRLMRENRSRLEKGGPPPQVWDKLKAQLVEGSTAKAKRLQVMAKWAVAAVLLLMAGLAVFVYYHREDSDKTAKQKTPAGPQQTIVEHNTTLPKDNAVAAAVPVEKTPAPAVNESFASTIAFYQADVQLKVQQVNKLLVTNPALEKDFKRAINDLNEIAKQLSAAVPASLDKQKVQQMIIENLQMQQRVLANELQALKSILAPGKQNDEKKFGDI